MQGFGAHIVVADRLNMLSSPAAFDDTSRLQICDETLQAAEQHQDSYLLAAANFSRAFFMMVQG